jgi:hypothetical protein
MNISVVIKVMICSAWILMSCTAIAMGVEMLGSDKLSISYQGESVKSGLSYFYIGAGITFILQTIATYYRKKISVILPSLLIVFSLMALYDELAMFTNGGLVQYKYLTMYAVILLVCISSVYMVVYNRVGCRKNA